MTVATIIAGDTHSAKSPLRMNAIVFMLLPNVRGQPRDERLSKTENGRVIALCCDVWFGVGGRC